MKHWPVIALSMGMAGSALEAQPLEDPIPEEITWNGLTFALEDVATVPASATSRPLARINMVRPAPDESGRLFVNDMRGPLWAFNPEGAFVLFLNLDAVFADFIDGPGLGTGFASFAFHPEFATNGKFYTAHSEEAGSEEADFGPPGDEDVAQQSVIVEWTLSDPEANFYAGTRRELMRIDQTQNLHAVQEIAFNPYAQPGEEDYGLLYICLGDAGSVNIGKPGNVNNPQSVYGSILRIDPLGTGSANGAYAIPPTNPRANDSTPGIVREAYAWGFRNPHRLSWDPADSTILYVGDIGEGNIEEVNQVVAGGNYGWPHREGTFLFDPEDNTNVYPLPPSDPEPFLYPVAQYDHDEGVAIVLGPVYRGGKVPPLEGWVILGDIRFGTLFAVDSALLELGQQALLKRFYGAIGVAPVRSLVDLVAGSRADLRFGYDDAGEILVLTKADGRIRRLGPAVWGSPAPVPRFEKVSVVDGQLRFRTVPITCYRLEASTDGENWEVVEPLIVGTGAMFVRGVSLDEERRFFRAFRLLTCF